MRGHANQTDLGSKPVFAQAKPTTPSTSESKASSAQYNDARALLRSSRFSKAVEVYRALLTDAPEEAALRFEVGHCYEHLGNIDRAVHHYEKAARAYEATGQAQLAVEVLRAMHRIHPNDPALIVRIGRGLHHLEELEELELVVNHLLQLHLSETDRSRLWALQVRCRMHAEDTESWFLLGATLVCLRREDAAAEIYLIVAERILADARDARSRARAEKALATAARLTAPSRVAVAERIAKCLVELGAYRIVSQMIDRIIEKSEGSPRLREYLFASLRAEGRREDLISRLLDWAEISLARGDTKVMVTTLDRVVELGAKDVRVLEQVAEILTSARELAGAAHIWRRVAMVHKQAKRTKHYHRAVIAMAGVAREDEATLELAVTLLDEIGDTARAKVARSQLTLLVANRARQQDELVLVFETDS